MYKVETFMEVKHLCIILAVVTCIDACDWAVNRVVEDWFPWLVGILLDATIWTCNSFVSGSGINVITFWGRSAEQRF